MSKSKNYKKTLIACYLGLVTQAITANFASLLFLTFKESYGLSLEKISLIPTVFFLTQLIVDFAATKFVDKIGYRICIVASQIFAGAGFILLAVLPEVLTDPFTGILLSVALYAVGSGLIEVLVSPIIEACPFENKNGMMSLLHSFYCWGVVAVILGSTLFFVIFGVENWKILAVLWSIVPLVNAFNFISCPIEKLTEEGESMGVGRLFKTPVFWLMVVLMICAGASEISMAQWASAFTESALGVSKTAGDLLGPCLFAMFMGISRALYGKFSKRLELSSAMLFCGIMAVACYLLATLTDSAAIGLVGCALCGFAVGIMWPGSLSLSAQKCPKGSTALFAFLALSGDLGGTLGPAMVGTVSERTGGNIKVGLLSTVIFPALLAVSVIVLRKKKDEVEQ